MEVRWFANLVVKGQFILWLLKINFTFALKGNAVGLPTAGQKYITFTTGFAKRANAKNKQSTDKAGTDLSIMAACLGILIFCGAALELLHISPWETDLPPEFQVEKYWCACVVTGPGGIWDVVQNKKTMDITCYDVPY